MALAPPAGARSRATRDGPPLGAAPPWSSSRAATRVLNHAASPCTTRRASAGVTCTGSTLDSGATLLTEFPRSGRPLDPEDLPRFGRVIREFRAVRRMGSTALHLAYVAAGRADATFGLGTNAWDIAAGVLLIQQAGGRFLVPPGNAAAREQPWLSPDYFGVTPELDLEKSILGTVVWQELFGAREPAPAR